MRAFPSFVLLLFLVPLAGALPSCGFACSLPPINPGISYVTPCQTTLQSVCTNPAVKNAYTTVRTQNDAGTGHDASDSPSSPTSIPKATFSGTLVDTFDERDYYRFSTTVTNQTKQICVTPASNFNVALYVKTSNTTWTTINAQGYGGRECFTWPANFGSFADGLLPGASATRTFGVGYVDSQITTGSPNSALGEVSYVVQPECDPTCA